MIAVRRRALLRSLALGLAIATAFAAEPRLILECEGIALPDLPLRCDIRGVDLLPGRGSLVVALFSGGRQVTRTDLGNLDAASLAQGIRAVLPATDGALPADRLSATWTDASRRSVSADLPITSMASLRERYAGLDRRFGPRPDPLPALWLEQAAGAALSPRPAQSAEVLRRTCDALESWLDGRRPNLDEAGSHQGAYRDSVDDSVQPFWLHRPEGAVADRAVLLLRGQPTLTKDAWTRSPSRLVRPWLDAGLRVVEAYPAGDRAWTGFAPRRAGLAWDAAIADPTCQRILVGVGDGANAALLLAEHDPQRTAAVILLDASLPIPLFADPTAEVLRPLRQGGLRRHRLDGIPILVVGAISPRLRGWIDHAQADGLLISVGDLEPASFAVRNVNTDGVDPFPDRGSLPGWSTRPVAVIVGTGEHQAAAQANQDLSTALIRAWVEHAGGRPTVRSDQQGLEGLTGHDLICIGGPRSNHVVADLCDAGLDLGLSWDARELRSGDRRWLRAEGRPVCLRRPRPDGGWVTILDGIHPWPSDAAPTTNLPDTWVGGPDGLAACFAVDGRKP